MKIFQRGSLFRKLLFSFQSDKKNWVKVYSVFEIWHAHIYQVLFDDKFTLKFLRYLRFDVFFLAKFFVHPLASFSSLLVIVIIEKSCGGRLLWNRNLGRLAVLKKRSCPIMSNFLGCFFFMFSEQKKNLNLKKQTL